MFDQELFDLRKKNVFAALAHEEGDYVPIMANAIMGSLDYAGAKFSEVCGDPQAYASALNKVYDDMWADAIWTDGLSGTYGLEGHFGEVQYQIAPDDISLTHVQLPQMQKDEYPQLIEDPNAFVYDVLLPRRFPRLFEDRAWAKEGLELLADNLAHVFGDLTSAAYENVVKEHNVLPCMSGTLFFQNPVDILFDKLRGFKGTITDLRRQPDNVKAALEKLWEARIAPLMAAPMEKPFPYPAQFTHMPAYMSPKQYREFYWPYEKKIIEWVASQGSKLLIVIEGKWANILDCFLEVPKDSCVIFIDDDDTIEVNEVLGEHQILCGGVKLVSTRTDTAESALEYTKRCIDACAPGGGFFLTTDKSWVSPGDVNKTLVDVMNAAHEYSKR